MALTVRAVDAASFDDVQTVLGTRGQAARCQCQGYRLGWYDQHSADVAGRRELLRDQVAEAYPMKPAPGGKDVPWGELHVGELQVFLDAGYRVAHVPSLRRVVVRYEF